MNITTVTPANGLSVPQRPSGSAVESPTLVPVADEPESPGKVVAMPREQLDSVVASMQSAMQSIRRDINFQVDDSTGRVVVKVVDGSSGEVVRQIPSEEALELAARLEDMRSLLFREEA
ncbi:MAG: flagellar biosynthesis protein FlaG [Gammaproteobacteria bacterium HGW-Gammaproteobacteria-12]|nr:MAG: flagellar biosynthesis protein FlaG [Gammaproteobacteria bacterium HGW-Gammaproteobacteria-12]